MKLATLQYLTKKKRINRALFYEISNPPSHATKQLETKVQANRAKYLKLRNKENELEKHKLLEPNNLTVTSINNFLKSGSENLIIDISAFPKKFFFPIIKLILLNKNIKNIVVTYTTPQKYCEDDLSWNPESWSHLPLFMPVQYPEQPIDLAIVGVGFMPFALPKLLLGKYNATPVKFLFPFPPGPPNYQRTWEFVRKIEKSFNFKSTDNLIRVDSNNFPDAYNYLVSETDNGNKKAIFAPYGPKPISLAMCLYASKYNSPVYYTQPRDYNPEYSTGIKETFAYCIKLNGVDLY